MNFPVIILTLFPEDFPGPLGGSILGRALKKGVWELSTVNIRDFATDKHKTVDDTPYGGGAGMVMRPDVVAAAIAYARENTPGAPVVYLSPSGTPFGQRQAEAFSANPAGLILLCGHYEGIDQRVLDACVDMEISIGDYVLTGGELAAMVVVDAVVRLLPGVLGNHGGLEEESFTLGEGKTRLLEYPHYTRPEIWENREVPEVLRSGHHGKIAAWRRRMAEEKTRRVRPDLLPDGRKK